MTYNEHLADRIRAALKGIRGIEEKKLFGGLGFMIRGNMACGVHKDELLLRLAEDDFGAAITSPHARIFDISGRPMKGWLLMAKEGYSSEKALQGWVRRSLAFARSLPPK